MAVTYYYPSPAINVGKGFLGEFLTGFVGQRKEDHRLMITRKLQALDPTKLIELENQTLKNIGALQKQISSMVGGAYAARARYKIALVKSRGSIKVQEVAAEARLKGIISKGEQDLVGKIYATTYKGYGDFIKNHRPDSDDMRTLTIGIRGGGQPSGYISGIRAAFGNDPGNEEKKEWLVHKALQIAKARGHKTAYAEIVRMFSGSGPNKWATIGAADPWTAFLGKYPQLDPMTLADRILAKHGRRATPGVRKVIKGLIQGDKDDLGDDMPEFPTAGIDMLRGYLAQERAELADVRTQRKEMQEEYYKTAISSYMTPWLAPSYTKAPKWEADFERLGVVGAQDRTAFDHYMMRAYDPENKTFFGDPDPEKIRAAEHEEAMFMGGEAVTSPLTPAFTAPGTAEGLDELQKEVDEYRQLVRKYGQGGPRSEVPTAKLYEIYQMVRGSKAMPGNLQRDLRGLRVQLEAERAKGTGTDTDVIKNLTTGLKAEKAKGAGADAKHIDGLEQAIRDEKAKGAGADAKMNTKLEQAIKAINLPQYRYGETGAAIQGIIDSAVNTGNYQNVHRDVIGTMQRGLSAEPPMAEVVREGGEAAQRQAMAREAQAPSTEWPYRDVNRDDLARLQAMNSTGLRAWYQEQKALHGTLGKSGPELVAKRRMLGLMKYVYDPTNNKNLLNFKQAEEKVAKLEGQKEAVVLPEFSARQKVKRARVTERSKYLIERMEGLKVLNPETQVLEVPEPTEKSYQPYMKAFVEHERLKGELARIDKPQQTWLKAKAAFDPEIKAAREALAGFKPRGPIPSEDVTGPYTAGRWTWTPPVRRKRQGKFKTGWRAKLGPAYRGLGLPQGAIEISLNDEDVARLNEIARNLMKVPGAVHELAPLYDRRKKARAVLNRTTGSVTAPELDAARATLEEVGPQIQATVTRLAEKDERVRTLQEQQDAILSAAEARGPDETPAEDEGLPEYVQ